jgi:hypothetical protein
MVKREKSANTGEKLLDNWHHTYVENEFSYRPSHFHTCPIVSVVLDYPTRHVYKELFTKYESEEGACWLEKRFRNNQERNEWRQTALCFVGAMYDAGDI